MSHFFSLKYVKYLSWMLVALVVLSDQTTKWLVVAHFDHGQTVSYLPFLSVTLAFNHGIAFGELSALHDWQSLLLLMSIMAVVIGLAVWLARLDKSNAWLSFALSFILGGAVGNLIDRLNYGYVIDFIDFNWGEWHWFIFNVADIAISMGVAMMLLLMWVKRDDSTSSVDPCGHDATESQEA